MTPPPQSAPADAGARLAADVAADAGARADAAGSRAADVAADVTDAAARTPTPPGRAARFPRLAPQFSPLRPAPPPPPGRPLVMGICNVTPDSFSDGGCWPTPDAAIAHAITLAADGADIIDVGGESTRPGAPRVDPATESARVLPVIKALVSRGICVSVDTMTASLAGDAVAAGAAIINDVSAGLADPAMLTTVAQTDAVYVAMHWRGQAAVMDARDRYDDVVGEVRDELAQRLAAAIAAGIAPHRIVLDPGLGFAKTGANNWPLLARLDELAGLGYPLLVGASRKRFLGAVLPDRDGAAPPPPERDAATAAVSALAAAAGAWCLRVHDVAASVAAVRVAAAWREAEVRDQVAEATHDVASFAPAVLATAAWHESEVRDQAARTRNDGP